MRVTIVRNDAPVDHNSVQPLFEGHVLYDKATKLHSQRQRDEFPNGSVIAVGGMSDSKDESTPPILTREVPVRRLHIPR